MKKIVCCMWMKKEIKKNQIKSCNKQLKGSELKKSVRHLLKIEQNFQK